jgi:putative transposase
LHKSFQKLAPGGRPRTVALFAVVNAILYVLCQGCTWRALPGDFPALSTVHSYFRQWQKDGTWLQVHDKLYQWVRVSAGRDPSPSEAAVDSQSVEIATMISLDVGYDAGKKIHGRKRHLSVDLLGLLLRVLVTSAALPERQGAKQVLHKVHRMEGKVKRLHTIWMDGGYRGEDFMRWVMDTFRWLVEIVLRPLEKKGFVHLPKRWVVERTFGWLNWCRRLSKDYERLPETERDFHLYRHDSYYGSTGGMIFDLLRLFKHPLSNFVGMICPLKISFTMLFVQL